MTNAEITKRVQELVSVNAKYRGKYLRNLRLYTYSMNISLDDIKSGDLIGYWNMNNEYTSSVQENVIQSCIDSLTSQLASKNTRAYFTVLNGTFNDFMICKQSQHFFDQLYDEQKVTKKVTSAFKDACIFGKGVIYIDPETKQISKALPWQVFTLPAENTYNGLTRAYYQRNDYPSVLLDDYKGRNDYVKYGVYYDTKEKVKATIIDGKITKTEKYDSDFLPFVFIHYNDPITGNDTSSVVDILYGIQMKIDDLWSKVSKASRLNPALTFFVPEGSNIKATQLNNDIGNVITYRPAPNQSGTPVVQGTQPFIDAQYLTLIQQLKNDAYELVGISKLSAQSVKPAGLDSGAALKTMANIESERFEVQYKEVINAYVNIAKTCINVFPKDDEVLPQDRMRLSIKWSDVVDEYNKMTIQFSGMDILSKDPSTKYQQIQSLIAMNILPRSRISQLLEIPDLEAGYSFSQAGINVVMAKINEAIVNENYEIPPYVPMEMLQEEIISTMMSLRACGGEQNEKDVDKLMILYNRTLELSNLASSQLANTNTNNNIGETVNG